MILLSTGHAISPRGFWYSWPVEPLVAVGLFAGLVLYLIGWKRLSLTAAAMVPRWRWWCYIASIVTIVLALLSPIAAYSEQLFAMHMVQHLLLLLIAPPLLLLGAPLLPALWALPVNARRAVGRRLAPGQVLHHLGHALTTPLIAVALYVVTVAIWHVPVMYDAAQGRTVTHDLEHLMFFGTALLYWWPVMHPSRGRRRLSYGLAVPYLVPPLFEGMLIGVLLAFSSVPLYETYRGLDTAPIWGLSSLDDQQLGGLIMWVPGGLFFLIPLIGVLTRLLNQESERPYHDHVANRASQLR